MSEIIGEFSIYVFVFFISRCSNWFFKSARSLSSPSPKFLFTSYILNLYFFKYSHFIISLQLFQDLASFRICLDNAVLFLLFFLSHYNLVSCNLVTVDFDTVHCLRSMSFGDSCELGEGALLYTILHLPFPGI